MRLVANPGCPWKSMVSTISVKDRLLPKDRRKKPWPDIRKNHLKHHDKYGAREIRTHLEYFGERTRRASALLNALMSSSALEPALNKLRDDMSTEKTLLSMLTSKGS